MVVYVLCFFEHPQPAQHSNINSAKDVWSFTCIFDYLFVWPMADGRVFGKSVWKTVIIFYCSILVTLLEWKWHTSASRWWLLKKQSRFAAGFRAQEVFGFVHWKQPCMDVEPVWWQCWTHRVGIAWRWWCSA